LRGLLVATVCLVLFCVLVVPTAVVILYPRPFLPSQDVGAEEEGGMVEGGLVLKVFMADSGQIENIPLEDYLLGVVAGEMPARFEEEALKAQAVAARTYALKRLKSYGGSGCVKHPEADICTDPSCCQAYLREGELRRRWGVFSYPTYQQKIADAVKATNGLVITYDHELIDPLYHASCGGLGTEDASAVWGNAVPYLKPVVCQYDDDGHHATAEAVLTLQELEKQLGEPVTVPVSGGLDLKVSSRTPGGRVKDLQVGSSIVAGTEVRRLLSLNSTGFTWRLDDGGKVVFTTYGKGHGVGLCQYGANGMAKKSHDFFAILKHYYTGVEIEPLPGINPSES
jgi:stage II sporulation protein D